MLNLIIVGATGLVGLKMLEVLCERNIKVDKLLLFASIKSKGRKLYYKDKYYLIEELNLENILKLEGYNYALMAVNKSLSKKYSEILENKGIKVIDNSSAFRLNDDIVLGVPLINKKLICNSKRKIIANPNCSTLEVIIPLFEINKINRLKEIKYVSLQAVSGAGQKGIKDYEENTNKVLPYLVKKTIIPFIGEIEKDNYCQEEVKMIEESKKILKGDYLIDSFTLRVPIKYGHLIVVYLKLENMIDLKKIYEALKRNKKIVILDDNKRLIYPNSIISFNNDFIYVGRFKIARDDPFSLSFVVNADNLRVGAASNAIDILELLINN